MTKWSNPTANDPEPETEPQSLNQGTLCGAIGNKDYNAPRNALGGPMRTTIQANWTSGQEVIVEVVLTAHHKVRVHMMFVFSLDMIMHFYPLASVFMRRIHYFSSTLIIIIVR